ncbi:MULTISPECIES: 2'-5' RNA ligase family protein [Corynebacterium]|uniref:2'-5' RNA ligase family protein n=1 Tax=Corynebacterium TaxID=1716 RepID=UPI0008A9B6FC|nr:MULTISPECIES: 2'-5' RNA ligase family protein [Corynebacterium]ASE56343.1 2'-5' RNA ligase [Corynebacterium jeikeium]KAA9225072.1 2'-5' RNA ligase [Corynebacterium amycolatum]MDK6442853.1 2'-5' RNA ligase family protein [Corynebacterium amycolatum]OHR33802.1 2'-5' RNA ligase [Corynebacterium sp. HMSC074C05]
MVSPDNILMYLLPEQETQVREIFAQLAESGLPQQNQKPHITVTFAPTMRPVVIQRAAEILPPLMPAEFRRVGTVVFGTKSKQTVAWLLETSDELEEAARAISRLNPDGRGSRWIPHLTMGLRIPRDIVPDYVRALDEITNPHFKTLNAPRAAFWSPKVQELTEF